MARARAVPTTPENDPAANLRKVAGAVPDHHLRGALLDLADYLGLDVAQSGLRQLDSALAHLQALRREELGGSPTPHRSRQGAGK